MADKEPLDEFEILEELYETEAVVLSGATPDGSYTVAGFKSLGEGIRQIKELDLDVNLQVTVDEGVAIIEIADDWRATHAQELASEMFESHYFKADPPFRYYLKPLPELGSVSINQ